MSYAPPPFDGVTIIQVPPGTEIVDSLTGERDIVTEEQALGLNGLIYVTPKNFEALKARVPIQDPQESPWRA